MKSRALRFLPLAFLAGTHGFALFAPYVGLVLAAMHLRTIRRERGRARERAAATAAGLDAAMPVGLPAPALA